MGIAANIHRNISSQLLCVVLLIELELELDLHLSTLTGWFSESKRMNNDRESTTINDEQDWSVVTGKGRKRRNSNEASSSSCALMSPPIRKCGRRDSLHSFYAAQNAATSNANKCANAPPKSNSLLVADHIAANMIDTNHDDFPSAQPRTRENGVDCIDLNAVSNNDLEVRLKEVHNDVDPPVNQGAQQSCAQAADSLLARIADIQRTLFSIAGRDSIAQELFEPEKSELNINDYLEHFASVFEGAKNRMTLNISANLAPIANLTEHQRTSELLQMRMLKVQLTNNIMRIRDGILYDNKVRSMPIANSDLTNVDEVRSVLRNSISRIEKSAIATHYLRILEAVQERIRSLRANLPPHRVLYSAVVSEKLGDAQRKMRSAAKNLVPVHVPSNPNRADVHSVSRTGDSVSNAKLNVSRDGINRRSADNHVSNEKTDANRVGTELQANTHRVSVAKDNARRVGTAQNDVRDSVQQQRYDVSSDFARRKLEGRPRYESGRSRSKVGKFRGTQFGSRARFPFTRQFGSSEPRFSHFGYQRPRFDSVRQSWPQFAPFYNQRPPFRGHQQESQRDFGPANKRPR